MFRKLKYRFSYLFAVLLCLAGCSKLVEIPEPVDTITTSETFRTNANANSALAGIYFYLAINGSYTNGSIDQCVAASADELKFSNTTDFTSGLQQNALAVFSASQSIASIFWTPIYSTIYQANAAIEGLTDSKTLSDSVKNQLLGEAKFIRAFCHFYLVNFFGDVPLVTTTAYAKSNMSTRAPVAQVYQQIVADLLDAANRLAADYSVSLGERIRPNKWAAKALLARVYLYTGDWANAIKLSSEVISHTDLYNLVGDLNQVFLANSREAIWQIQILDQPPYATGDAYQFIPPTDDSSPSFYMTDQLLGAFEPADTRRLSWVDSTDYGGTFYYYPFKYKVKEGSQGNITEYIMVLRLAEQYLIHAEASANTGGTGLDDAINDLNLIRIRAGLPGYLGPLDKDSVLAAIYHERQIELFSEFGHRWFDLKRTGMAHQVLSNIDYKQPWHGDYQLLYPIPITELQNDPNLVQNSGY